MKNLHRNWNHIIQSNLNVGDLVHYSEQQGYGSSKPFALCIITELCLGKKDRKTRSDWWNKAHPNQRHNPSSSVVTNFVTNTARDNCKFNSITMMDPATGKKWIVLLHPTYKDHWRVDNLAAYFYSQEDWEQKQAEKNHDQLVRDFSQKLTAAWRAKHQDLFDKSQENFEPRHAKHTYHLYQWLDHQWDEFLRDAYSADKNIYDASVKASADAVENGAGAMDPMEMINNLNALSPRLTITKFVNGVSVADEGPKGRLEIDWKWSIRKTRQWFEDYVGKDFVACETEVHRILLEDLACPLAVAEDVLRMQSTELAFTSGWFHKHILTHRDREAIVDGVYEGNDVAPYGNDRGTSVWSYDLA